MDDNDIRAWRAQIDMASTSEEMERIVRSLRNLEPALFLLIDAAEKKREFLGGEPARSRIETVSRTQCKKLYPRR